MVDMGESDAVVGAGEGVTLFLSVFIVVIECHATQSTCHIRQQHITVVARVRNGFDIQAF